MNGLLRTLNMEYSLSLDELLIFNIPEKKNLFNVIIL